MLLIRWKSPSLLSFPTPFPPTNFPSSTQKTLSTPELWVLTGSEIKVAFLISKDKINYWANDGKEHAHLFRGK